MRDSSIKLNALMPCNIEPSKDQRHLQRDCRFWVDARLSMFTRAEA